MVRVNGQPLHLVQPETLKFKVGFSICNCNDLKLLLGFQIICIDMLTSQFHLELVKNRAVTRARYLGRGVCS